MSKRFPVWIAMAALVIAPAAMAQQAPMVNVLQIHIQLGHQQHYEMVLKDLWQAFKKAGVATPIFVNTSTSDPGTYTFVAPIASLAELEKLQTKVDEAFAAVPDVMEELQEISISQDQSIWATRPDLSYTPEKPRVAETEARFTRIVFLYPHPNKATALESVLKEGTALRKKHGIADASAIGQLVIGSDGPTYAVLIDAKDEADFYVHNAKTQEKLGEEWQALLDKAGPMLRKVEFSSAVNRPDLAYTP